MISDFRKCTSFAQFADMAAVYERLTKYHKPRHSPHKNLLLLPTEYPSLKKENLPLKLCSDVHLFAEFSRKQWLRANLDGSVLDKNVGTIEILDGKDADCFIRETARVASYVYNVAQEISRWSLSPVFVICNARGASLYHYGFRSFLNQIGDDSLRKEFVESASKLTSVVQKPIAILQTARKFIKEKILDQFIYPVRNLKISSHECVQSEKEALLLSGADPIKTKLRRHFSDKIPNAVEYIPEYFLSVLKEGYPILFVDPPSWGVDYASSMGIDRKKKDILKRNMGLYRPYKMKSYLDYSHYQIGCLSMSKIHNPSEESIKILEEQLDTIDPDYPFAILLNPEKKRGSVWWDNKPQVLGKLGARFSSFYVRSHSVAGFRCFDTLEKHERIVGLETFVSTSFGTMKFSEYVQRTIKWHILGSY